jgi:ribosomal protein S18 acetylase RimI-like enzyme
MKLKQIVDENEKSQICDSVLRLLPNWFGIESAIVDYSQAVRSMNMWVCERDEEIAGFISIEMHNTYSAEIHVMGVLEKFQNQQIGKSLIQTAIQNLKNEKALYLQVKTLSEKHPDLYYARTRNFYKKMGFVPIQEFPELWGKSNPCLQMILKI